LSNKLFHCVIVSLSYSSPLRVLGNFIIVCCETEVQLKTEAFSHPYYNKRQRKVFQILEINLESPP